MASHQPGVGLDPGIRHHVLDFYERELVTLGGRGVDKKKMIIVLVKPRRDHRNMSNSQRMFSDTFTLSLTPFIEDYTRPIFFRNASLAQNPTCIRSRFQ